MTQLLVLKSPCVWKKLGGWGCGSEQAPLINKWGIDGAKNQNFFIDEFSLLRPYKNVYYFEYGYIIKSNQIKSNLFPFHTINNKYISYTDMHDAPHKDIMSKTH